MVTRRNIWRNVKRLNALLPVLAACAISVIPANANDQKPECMLLASSGSSAEFFDVFEKAIAGVYKTAGFCAQSIQAAPKRIEQMMAAGTLDGDWIRVEDHNILTNQDLLPIPMPLFALQTIFVSLESSNFDGTEADLKDRRVGHAAGFRWIEARLPASGSVPMEVPSTVPVVELLSRGRFDVYVTVSANVASIRDQAEKAKQTVQINNWTAIPVYHYIHARHADKLDALTEALKVAYETGAFDAIYTMPGITRISEKPNP